ncbi:MAG: tRNA epoxyqueuosine(34) reductase QueG [Cryomorphaceae bacterium]|jgi:epoxyqueuosine reductase|nr:tRNA epoxyqueuosine(34) reductase QueG [Cryomorphaceae bacterium]
MDLKSIARTNLIKEKASELGFFSCSISKAQFLEEEAHHLETWLKNGFQGKMSYMENHFDKRLDPRLLVEGARSVVTLLFNYYSEQKQSDPDAPKLSMYAYGEDYHDVVKEKLKELLQHISVHIGEVNGRAFVDSAPVMDKAWAKRSGAGWIGKHTNLISKRAGSYFFIAELILDLELESDGPVTDHCGTCTKCIDACPTEAIVAPYVVDGSKCISYLTIELKDELIPSEFRGKMDHWMFGCDVCQSVCPWNRFSKQHSEPRFAPKNNLLDLSARDWTDLSEELFEELFKKSAVKRTKYSGLKRNISFLSKG